MCAYAGSLASPILVNVLASDTYSSSGMPKRSLGTLLASVCKPANIPVNPPEIVDVSESGFEVHTDKMKPYIPCMIHFDGSKYMAWKDKDKALVLTEVA